MATLLRVSAKYITYYYNSRILSKLVLAGLNFHASLYLPFSGVSLFSRLFLTHYLPARNVSCFTQMIIQESS